MTLLSSKASRFAASGVAGLAVFLFTAVTMAYDGTNCRADGNCWEPKPGFPETIAGTEYDPQHDPEELRKQQESYAQMEDRNQRRAEHFRETGEWVYDIDEI